MADGKEIGGKGMRLTDKNSIIEALKSGRKVFSIGVSRRLTSDKRVGEMIELAGRMGVPVTELPDVNYDKRRGERPSLIEARCEDYSYASLDDIREKVTAAKDGALVVALDHVQDPRNFGAILRTAAAAGALGVIIEKKRCCDVTETVYETSCGGADRVPVVMVSNLRNALVEMKKWGCWIAGADERAEKDCYGEDLTSVSVLVLGSEGEGLSRLIREECDYIVRVPTAPDFASLNVSVAAGILIFEAVRQKRSKSGRDLRKK